MTNAAAYRRTYFNSKSAYSKIALMEYYSGKYSPQQAANEPRFSRRRVTYTLRLAQSAKINFTNRRVRAVGWKRWLGGNAGLKLQPIAQLTPPYVLPTLTDKL
jgi:hypothetical protein